MKNIINFKKLLRLIPSNHKQKIPIYFFNNLLIVFFEILSLRLIYSIIKILINEDSLFQVYLDKFSLNNITNLSLFLVAIFITKNFLLIYLYHWQYRYAANIQRYLSCNLLKNYLFLNYEEYLSKNSSIYLRNVESECSRFSNYLLSILTLVTEIIILISLIVYLLFMNLNITLIIIFAFVVISIFYFFLTKKKFKIWGENRLFLSGALIQSLIETFQNIKEIKIYGKEELFYGRFRNFQKSMQNLAIKINLIRIAPRPILEIFAVMFVAFFLLFIEKQNLNWINYLPILTVYLVTFLRILPSGNKILHNYQNIILNNPSIEVLNEEFKKKANIENISDTKYNSEKVEIKNISYGYNKSKPIIKNFSFNFEDNNIYGIFGENGSGKTTLINIILGLIKPDSGEVLFYNNSKKVNPNRIKFGYVPQNTILIDSSIKANIALEHDEKNIDQQKIENCINSSSLFNFIKQFEKKENTFVGENGIKLSGGQKQRIGIARSLFFKANILILDEPSSALDKSNEHQLLNDLKKLKENKIIIIVSHNDDFKNYCDKIIQL